MQGQATVITPRRSRRSNISARSTGRSLMRSPELVVLTAAAPPAAAPAPVGRGQPRSADHVKRSEMTMRATAPNARPGDDKRSVPQPPIERIRTLDEAELDAVAGTGGPVSGGTGSGGGAGGTRPTSLG